MRVLFIHRNFPGQFGHLVRELASRPGVEVVGLGLAIAETFGNVRSLRLTPTRSSRAETHHYVQSLESAVLLGQAAYRACVSLRDGGFVPDLIYAHAGFGPGLYVKDAFPGVPVIGHFEWFYRARDGDADFLGPDEVTDDDALRIRTRNAALLLELEACDAGLCPTEFQRDRFPPAFRDKLRVIHEGVDTAVFSPPAARPARIGALDIAGMAEIVTYATRGMEPYRGFPQFVRALAIAQARRPGLHAVIIGEDAVFYGKPRRDGRSWKDALLAECRGLDRDRTHFTGTLPLSDYRRGLEASHVHVYLTVPFVPSWSLLEAMATGCPVIGSDTAPVREFVTGGQTGLLADFFDCQSLAGAICYLLEDRDRAQRLGRNARRRITGAYGLDTVLPRHLAFASEIAGREIPAPAEPTALSAGA